jgi:hypothetical protein
MSASPYTPGVDASKWPAGIDRAVYGLKTVFKHLAGDYLKPDFRLLADLAWVKVGPGRHYPPRHPHASTLIVGPHFLSYSASYYSASYYSASCDLASSSCPADIARQVIDRHVDPSFLELLASFEPWFLELLGII